MMEFSEFAERAEAIDGITANLEIIDNVADLFSRTNDDLAIATRFVQGKVFPSWDERKLDIGPSLLYEALSLASGESEEKIEELVKDKGDVGLAAESLSFGRQQTLVEKELTLTYVYESLEDIAQMEGEGSQSTKVRTLSDLFMECSPLEARYLARLVLGEMRIGVGEGTVRDAIVEAFDVDKSLVERGIMVTNDVAEVAHVARDQGDEGLRELEVVVGRPIQPMLAQTGSIGTVLEDVGSETETEAREVAVEWKYDGARIQIHKEGEDIELYSRNLENVTNSLPDVIEVLRQDVKDDKVILDAEVVATEDGKPLPFQEVLRRFRRKYNIDEMTEKVELNVHVFDVLYREGELIDLPLRERYEHLDESLEGSKASHWFVTDTDSVREIESEALEAGQEGLMVKNPDSAYTPGKRGKNWLKIKPEPETLDLVVTGGEWGEGRRANLIGSYLLAVLNGDELKTIGKVATGLTDEQLEDLTERFEPLIESEDGKEIDFKPEVVFEVGYDEIQKSPKYSSGYALRFPRFLGVRDDKNVEDADSLERIENLYGKG